MGTAKNALRAIEKLGRPKEVDAILSRPSMETYEVNVNHTLYIAL